MIERPKRTIRQLSPEERERWLRAVQEEELAMPRNIAGAQRSLAAIQEESLSGELRRAIVAAVHTGTRVRDVAEQAGVPFETLNAFMGGNATLDSDQFSRVGAVLDCHLVPSG